MALDKFFPCGTFTSVENTIAITIETSKDDTSIDSGETGKSVSEILKNKMGSIRVDIYLNSS